MSHGSFNYKINKLDRDLVLSMLYTDMFSVQVISYTD
jgi:hypothetical protein